MAGTSKLLLPADLDEFDDSEDDEELESQLEATTVQVLGMVSLDLPMALSFGAESSTCLMALQAQSEITCNWLSWSLRST